MMWGIGRNVRRVHEIAPDEIFLDSSNLPEHNSAQFEGRVERPVSVLALFIVAAAFLLTVLVFMARAFDLEILYGNVYSQISRDNRLERSVIFATRGVIYDRNGKELVWNQVALSSDASSATSSKYALRLYTNLQGLSHLLGFIRYPKADTTGAWWRENYTGVSGVELAFDSILRGRNGSRMSEIDATGAIEREHIVSPLQNGTDLTLSVDSALQSELHTILSSHAKKQGFQGGASVIIDVRTGEVLAMVSFPSYNNAAFTAGNSASVREANDDPRTPLLNRAVAGLYTPGSIVKPILAAAALNERIIAADSEILSTGAITVPNPYDAKHPSVFKDWKVHGLVDMRTAIAVSSDEYFYTIGGGFGGQRGLGIAKIDEYARRFGLGTTTGIALWGEAGGVIPTPEWKKQVFGPNDPWRIGNTYHTAIGQYGFQITPIQAVSFVSALANGGRLMTPHLVRDEEPAWNDVGIPDEYLHVVRDGMRLAVTSDRSDATAKALDISGIHIAGKTGTAQIGAHNESMNSWAVGFWPAEHAHYAFATVLEKAPAGTLSGAAPGMRPFFEWLVASKLEYVN